uniref:DGPFAETKE family protein n=1 Tax=mine drainage metagenome TaxID=410659 RepID=E6PG85_9ZZZZ
MKFMALLKATADSEAGRIPEPKHMEAMISFNEQLAKDGVLLAAEGLRASAKGARLRFDGGRTTVIDGPFAETKELIAGFWIVQGKSREEVVERFARLPLDGGEVIEIREFFEFEDFQAALTPEQRARTERVTLDDLK